jgi:hypothetical protein
VGRDRLPGLNRQLPKKLAQRLGGEAPTGHWGLVQRSLGEVGSL